MKIISFKLNIYVSESLFNVKLNSEAGRFLVKLLKGGRINEWWWYESKGERDD
jgi:hypothetical protein